jgi:hypothetical protein
VCRVRCDANSTYIVYPAACYLLKRRDIERRLPNRGAALSSDYGSPAEIPLQRSQPLDWELYLTAKPKVL